MKKLASLLTLAVVMFFFGTGCDDIITDLTTPNVTATAINNGAELRLNWAPVTDAEGYKIDLDGTVQTTMATTFDVTTPARRISVWAYKGASESNKWTLDLAPVITASIDVWGIGDPSPDNPSGLGFTADGIAAAYSVSDAGNHAAIDYYMEDVALPGMNIVNSGDKGWNNKENFAKASGLTDFHAANIADAPGGYTTQQSLTVGGVYYLWLDRTPADWSVGDNYAKAKIVSIDGRKVTMQVAYQKAGGLRWLVTD